MRRIIILAAMAVIAAAAAAVWSFANPKVAGDVQVTDTSAQVSPYEIMIKQGNILPVEYWAHPF